ncbi:MAG: DUF99 family protein [Candidatus Aenigmarchaeota archaeon]|nr:DUF99 family protein [Candidatus Aenigmarchaeota archaeon]
MIIMYSVKDEIRILGFDDGPFKPRSSQKVLVVGVVHRGGKFFDGIMRTWVTCDGLDATKKINNMVDESKHKEEVQVLMFKGITIAGFNMIDIKELYKKTGKPVIVVMRKKPDIEEFKDAIKNFNNSEKRLDFIRNAGKIYKVKIKKNKSIYYQFIGLEKSEVEKIIKLSSTRSLIPEPLRVAHLIASAMVGGESRGRA